MKYKEWKEKSWQNEGVPGGNETTGGIWVVSRLMVAQTRSPNLIVYQVVQKDNGHSRESAVAADI